MALANITNNILTDSGILVTNLTPTTRTLTINGTTYDLSADRSWSIATGVGGSGTTNYLPKFTGASTIGNSQIFDNGTNVGIGNASPAAKLDVNGVALLDNIQIGTTSAFLTNSVNAMIGWASSFSGYTNGTLILQSRSSASTPIVFATGSTSASERMRLDASGNLGLGVTPSAWISGNLAFEIVSASGLSSDGTSIRMQTNAFVNTSGSWIYKSNGAASFYSTGAGAHAWYNAPSGTAGNAISFTQAMTLDASGRLSIGNTSVSAINERLNVTGNGIAIEDSDGGREMLLGHFGGADGILGTFTNDALQIRTNNTARLTIANSGAATFSANVGIGGSPSSTASLDINNGNIWVRTPSAVRGIQFGYSDSTHGSYRAAIMGGPQNYGGSDDGMITFHTQNGYVVSSTPPERMRITGGGNVGIGTTSPVSLLDLASGFPQLTFTRTDNSSNAAAAINFSSTSTVRWQIATNSAVGTGFEINQANGSTNRFYINTSGNVGIGTTSPGVTLDVSGSGIRITNATPNVYFNNNVVQWKAYMPTSTNNFAFSDAVRDVLTLGYNGAASYFNGCNVGIGTTSPAAILHTQQTSAGNEVTGLLIQNVGNSASTAVSLNFAPHENASSPTTLAKISAVRTAIDNAPTNLVFYTFNNTLQERMRITSGGNVGIGTTSPVSTLDVNGSINIPSGFNLTWGGAYGANIPTLAGVSGASGYLAIYPGGSTSSEKVRISNTGEVGIGTSAMSSGIPLSISAGSGLNTNIAFQQAGTNKWFIRNLDGTDDFSFYSVVNSAERMRITSGGSVLIGTTTEGFLGKLQVAGSVAITGQYNTVLPSSSFSYFDGSGQVVSSASSASALYLDTTWNTTGNPDGIYLNVTNTASGASSKLLNLKVGSVSQFSVSKAGAIQTSDPTNGTARPWKLGDARSGGISTDSYIIVEVNGVTYSIPALNGLP